MTPGWPVPGPPLAPVPGHPAGETIRGPASPAGQLLVAPAITRAAGGAYGKTPLAVFARAD